MRKMTEGDVKHIVGLLKKWKRRPLFWSHLQNQISIDLFAGESPWSRQSLQRNAAVNSAWESAQIRLGGDGSNEDSEHGNADSAEIKRLQAALDDLKRRYENLLIKHRQLVYNASMLKGGTHLLLDPLPDNTPAQKRSSGPKGARHS